MMDNDKIPRFSYPFIGFRNTCVMSMEIMLRCDFFPGSRFINGRFILWAQLTLVTFLPSSQAPRTAALRQNVGRKCVIFSQILRKEGGRFLWPV